MVDNTTDSRAVSPVIGVILMVAITVILAAVIGAFVLEIGDQQETAPNTSFDTEEKRYFYDGHPNFNTNGTSVDINHAGGDNIDYRNLHFTTNGLEMMWAISDPDDTDSAAPAPDLTETAGTNEPVGFQSGQSYRIVTSERTLERENRPYMKREWVGSYSDFDWLVLGGCEMVFRTNKAGGDGERTIWAEIGLDRDQFNHHKLNSGDEVAVVWEASSGGKTQKMMQYVVQRDSEPYDTSRDRCDHR